MCTGCLELLPGTVTGPWDKSYHKTRQLPESLTVWSERHADTGKHTTPYNKPTGATGQGAATQMGGTEETPELGEKEKHCPPGRKLKCRAMEEEK